MTRPKATGRKPLFANAERIHVLLDREHVDKLNSLAAERGLTRAQLMRLWLLERLDDTHR